MSKLTHFNAQGQAHMVDVGDKAVTQRQATAQGRIAMEAETLRLILEGGHKKGDVLGIARIAAIMAAKKASDLIPLCHPIAINAVDIEFSSDTSSHSISCRATVKTSAQTGVEMEALTAVQVALLTIYDMCKAVDRGMRMDEIMLLQKSGGKSGEWRRKGTEKP